MRGRSAILVGSLLVAIAPSCGGGSHGGTAGDDAGTAGSSGSGSSGATASSSSGSGAEGGTSCIGSSLLAALGKSHLLVGLANDATAAPMAPFDLQYQYISGGVPDGSGPCASCTSGCTVTNPGCGGSPSSGCWWGCWQDTSQSPGEFPVNFTGACQGSKPPQIPMFTYYQLLQASGVTEGAPEVTQAATNAAFMARYFADWRFLLQKIDQSVALLHIEPDFWGYAEQQSEDPTSLAAAVATANATDCASVPDTIAGMGQCMIAMVRKYAPSARVGLHASAWGTKVDVGLNTSATLDVPAVAQKTAAFLAACGERDADFVVVETSDRDAGYYQVVESKTTWWDATNKTLPDFHQDFAYVTALTEALGRPALYWQTPLGNTGLNDTSQHYQDNRVDYFFANMGELAAAHAVGAAFGAGAAGCTTPDTDNGNFVAKAKAYYAAGGQSLCP